MARRATTLERSTSIDEKVVGVGGGAQHGRGDGDADGEADAEDWTTVWSCVCGYGNVGRERCIRCGKRAPAEARAAGGLWMGTDRVTAVPSGWAGRKAWRTVGATIALNLLMQVLLTVVAVVANLGLATTVKLSLLSGLAYYTAVALWVLARSVDLGLRPRSGGSTALVGASEGFIVGGGLALLLVAVVTVAVGHPVLDPTTAVLAAQSSWAPLVIGFVLIALLGPVVEELVFRGFLAEAFRAKGRRSAVMISAVGFSLAHLRVSQFRYYVAMGVVFGLVYWRRGLVGSIAAHAAFNAMLIVVAVAATHGPAQHVRSTDFEVTIPAAWTVSESPSGDLVAADSPLGSRVELTHTDAPGIPDITLLARGLGAGNIPMPPGVALDYATVVVVDFPAGRAVAMSVDVDGQAGRLIMIPRGDRLWLASLRSGGEGRDATAFHDIVRSWRFR